MALDNVLANIPGLGGYLAMEQYKQQQALGGLQGALGVLNAVRAHEEAQQQAQLRPLQMQMLQAQIAQAGQRNEEAARQNRAREQFKAALPTLFPETPAKPMEMDAADNVMTPGTPATPNRMVPLLSAMADLDQGGISDVIKQLSGTGSGGRGADPMLSKVIADRNAALARGDTAAAQLLDQYAQRMAAGYTAEQLGRYQGFDYRNALSGARAVDEGVAGVPVAGARPMPGMPTQTPVPQTVPQAPTSQPTMQVAPEVQAQRDQARMALLQNEREQAKAAGNTQAVAELDREIAAVSRTAPSAPGISPKDERAVETARLKERGKDDAKRYDEFRAKITPLATTMRRLEVMRNMTANDQTFANAGANWKMQLSSLGQALGIDVNVDKLAKSESYVAEFAELVKERLASKDYGTGTGVSNLDLLNAGMPLPDIAKSKNGRLLIIDALTKDTREKIDDVNAFRTHYERNRGNMDGFRFPSEALAEQRAARLAQMSKNQRESTGRVRQGGPPAQGGVPGGIQFLGFE